MKLANSVKKLDLKTETAVFGQIVGQRQDISELSFAFSAVSLRNVIFNCLFI